MSLRNIKNNLMQFISIIAIGAIAVTLFVGLLSNADVFENQVNEVYTEGNLASLWVTTKSYDEEDEEKISSLLFDGDEISSRFYIPTNMSNHSVNLSVVHTLPTVSKPYGKIEGNYDEGFLLVDQDLHQTSSSKSGLFNIGDQITFSFDISSYDIELVSDMVELFCKEGKENCLEGDKLSIQSEITGFMNYPENITKASYNSSIVLMDDKAFKKALLSFVEENFKDEVTIDGFEISSVQNLVFEYICESIGFNSEGEYLTNPNQYLIRCSDKDINRIDDEIESYFSKKENNNLYMVTKRENMPFYVTIDNDVTQARQFTFVFPMVFFVVAILVILTTLSQMVLKDRSNIGTLKAIGVKNSHILLSYMVISFTLVLISIIIGCVIGPLIIPSILGNKYQIIYSLPIKHYVFPFAEAIIASISFIAISLLVTFLVTRKEISLKPSESMRPKITKIKHLGKEIKSEKKTSYFSLRMAIRNIFMNKSKSIMVMIGVLGCTALLVCGFGIEDTVNYGISFDLQNFYSQDITLTFNGSKSKADIEEDFSKIDGIEQYELTYSTATTAYIGDGKQMDTQLYVIPDNPQYKNVSFPIDSIAISQKVSRNIDFETGDEVSFTYNSTIYKCKAIVYDAFFYHGIMIHESNPIIKSGSLSYLGACLKISDNVNVIDIKEEFSSLPYVSDCKSKDDWQNNVNDVMSGVLVMTNAVKVFAIMLGIVVLYNLTLMNFKERNRDIATLKVLGFSSNETMLSLLFESIILTFIGVVLGMACGYPFLLAVMKTNIVALVEYIYVIYPITFVYSFILTFIVSILINLILSLRIKKVKMIESLKSVE